MKFKGTPAPWKLAPMGPNGCPVVGSGITMVAMLAHSVNEVDQADEARANANLIKAAPKLLEALQIICFFEDIPEPQREIAEKAIKEALGE